VIALSMGVRYLLYNLALGRIDAAPFEEMFDGFGGILYLKIYDITVICQINMVSRTLFTTLFISS
jgi:hypothetical protein